VDLRRSPGHRSGTNGGARPAEGEDRHLEQAMAGVEESQWIELSGYLRQVFYDGVWMRLELTASAGEFTAYLPPTGKAGKFAGGGGAIARSLQRDGERAPAVWSASVLGAVPRVCGGGGSRLRESVCRADAIDAPACGNSARC